MFILSIVITQKQFDRFSEICRVIRSCWSAECIQSFNQDPKVFMKTTNYSKI